MSLKTFQIQGYTDSEQEYQSIEKLIFEQYMEAKRQIDFELSKLFAKMGAVSGTQDQYNWLIQYDRYAKLKNQISQIYTKYDLKAQNITAQAGAVAISNNYYRQLYALEWTTPMISFSVLPDNLVEYAVTGQLTAWKALTDRQKKRHLSSGIWPPSSTLSDLFAKNRNDAILKIQRQINAGMISGESYTKISRRVRDVIGNVSKGEARGQMANALRIVRTEGNRLLNAGGYASTLLAVDQGAVISRVWDASLDRRTRPTHGTADGQKVGYDEAFSVGGEALMFPGDAAGSPGNIIHCRCTVIDLPGDWEPEARRGRNPGTGENEVFSYSDFDQWVNDNGLTRNIYGQIYKRGE